MVGGWDLDSGWCIDGLLADEGLDGCGALEYVDVELENVLVFTHLSN